MGWLVTVPLYHTGMTLLKAIRPARNFKFYPLSLRMAMDKGELGFVADKFDVQTCQGDRKLLKDLSAWELLNLRPKTILDIPQYLNEQFGISPKYLEGVLDGYNIQTAGKDVLERHFGITPEKPIVYMLGKSRHYSWPKGGGKYPVSSSYITAIYHGNESNESSDCRYRFEKRYRNRARRWRTHRHDRS